MLVTLFLATLSLSHASPAKAGVQLRTARYWAPAFAGEAEKEASSGSTATGPNGMTPIEAERAFADDAKKLGQWTAFRKWSADDAVMFVPQPINAHEWLKDRKDPAKAIDWWPTASYISCDGTLAVNTGGWKRPDGRVGYFSTVWQRQTDGGWRWIVDGGDQVKEVLDRPAQPKVVRARCKRGYFRRGLSGDPPWPPGYKADWKASGDATLSYAWRVASDGGREFSVSIAGSKTPVFTNDVAAPPK